MNNRRLSYLFESTVASFDRNRKLCPSCGSKYSFSVASKFLVTRLMRCKECYVLFRSPTDQNLTCDAFYQEDYEGGVATDLPAPEELEVMIREKFCSFNNSYWSKIDLVEKIGIERGVRVLDYGASWGYGTYQWCERGYEAEGFEIGYSRAVFGRENLGMKISSSTDELKGSFDIFFSCHVIEHIPKISDVFSLAEKLLKPGGLFIAFTPNGSAERRKISPSTWAKSWGLVHPLFLDKEYYLHEFCRKPLMMSSSPYTDINLWGREQCKILGLTGDELLVVVRF